MNSTKKMEEKMLYACFWTIPFTRSREILRSVVFLFFILSNFGFVRVVAHGVVYVNIDQAG